MVTFRDVSFKQTTIPVEINRYRVEITSFSFCHSKENGGAILCDRSLSSAQYTYFSVHLCSFFHCSTEKIGASIFTNSTFKLTCTSINHCHSSIDGGCLFSNYYSEISQFSSNYCKSNDVILRVDGIQALFTAANESNQYSNYQVSGVSVRAPKGDFKFFTFCHLYDKESCTIVFKTPQGGNLQYSNVLNSISSYVILLTS